MENLRNNQFLFYFVYVTAHIFCSYINLIIFTMAVEYKIDIDSGITERGIYLAELKVFHKEISVTQEVVFSRYHKEDTFKKFWQHYKVSHFGIKEKVKLIEI